MLLLSMLQLARLVRWIFGNDGLLHALMAIGLCGLIIGAVLIDLKWPGYKEEFFARTATMALFALAVSPIAIQVIRALR